MQCRNSGRRSPYDAETWGMRRSRPKGRAYCLKIMVMLLELGVESSEICPRSSRLSFGSC
jgi:hypothetical protein